MARNQTGRGSMSDNNKGNGSGNLVSMSDKDKGSEIGGSGMGKFGQQILVSKAKGGNLMNVPSAKLASGSSKKWLKKSTKIIPKGGLPGKSFGGFSVVMNHVYDAGSVFPSEAEPPDPVIEESDNAAVLQQLHMDVINSKGQCSELNGDGQINEMIPIETVLDLDSFEKTASNLVEVMAVISE
ncbi:hypothetical protein LWI29_036077 [Acer saccharum]|uniref:Uncharacterized protein n=1 Tax=Acer saccharum TaxID=4024 RepID=A0AA39T017_ACESA|nr:hypothetical protein LWI29_036077 [Acer saccharum]